MVLRYNGDPLGRSNYIKIVNLGKTRMEMRRNQDESTRNKTSKIERSEGIRDLMHVDKVLIIRFIWLILFTFMNGFCVPLQVSAMAGCPCNTCGCVCICVCPQGNSQARNCLQREAATLHLTRFIGFSYHQNKSYYFNSELANTNFFNFVASIHTSSINKYKEK